MTVAVIPFLFLLKKVYCFRFFLPEMAIVHVVHIVLMNLFENLKKQ